MIQEELNQIYNLYYHDLHGYASTFVGEDDADDVLVEVFTNVFVSSRSISDYQCMRGFLFLSVKCKCIDHIRRNSKVRTIFIIDDLFDEGFEEYNIQEDKESQAYDEYRLKMVHDIISQLPEKSKQIVELFYISGMKDKEISKLLSKKNRTVITNRQYGIKLIKEKLNLVNS